ncbi:rhodanese-like domain-containing protein [Thiohalobacter sp. COW1]|uniref:rhodanese-like domain-containing protein n=1 Tax=Thiohalobacter sp. COW1 TaxID=2795687 RepID=UPI001916A9C2|nr:rhodanese-like domain-containing protein [Thiohalobacter sp. COW1]BCO31966.1 rhodanese-like domain-containing protein [Thiohalobacter sp. COW1]
MRQLTPAEIKAHLEQAQTPPLLLDVREPWEYEVCRIEGSTLIPMRQIPLKAETLDPERETIVICHHGVRSYSVARYLEAQLGFSNVINLSGGVDAWARDVDPGMATY